MLTEETIVDQITVLYDGQIQVRQSTIVYRDGSELSRTYHRHVIAPGDDLGSEDTRVQAIGRVVHTPRVITAYRLARDEVETVA